MEYRKLVQMLLAAVVRVSHGEGTAADQYSVRSYLAGDAAEATSGDLTYVTGTEPGNPSLHAFFLDVEDALEHAPPAGISWVEHVRRLSELYTGSPDSPTLALWADLADWYDWTGRHALQSLGAVLLTCWLDPEGGGRRWLRLRYEVGRDRAAPEVRRNLLSLSVGTSL